MYVDTIMGVEGPQYKKKCMLLLNDKIGGKYMKADMNLILLLFFHR